MSPIVVRLGLVVALLLGGRSAVAQARNPLTVTATFSADAFRLVHAHRAASLVLDAADAEVVRVAAQAVAADIAQISGVRPAVLTTRPPADEYVVLAGTLGHSAVIDGLVRAGQLDVDVVRGKWESYALATLPHPWPGVKQALVVVGSDRRGAAYGLFELSRRLGVSPWSWWADVTPLPRPALYVQPGTLAQGEPTVKYRGIFLNDEDWGLRPWAAQHMDKDIKDIGPNTYARIFELLLRLKANLIWPAMHAGTRAFFQYPGNPQMAERYAIVVGSSHAEPMLRNNVDEWHEPTMGPFDYFQNKLAVQRYWDERARQAGPLEAIYSLGMRGVHDSGMQGAKTPQEAAQMLTGIIADQRAILRRRVAPDVARVPQVFTAYKEVLDIYDQGLKLPDDVTLVWPEDNYGYISRLSDAQEQRRPGGAGVYYHASYWGRPHDYLWLGTTHPGLVQEELMKARALHTDRLWVLNVGDIKPLEYSVQQFLDMAYDARPFEQSSYGREHLAQWLAEAFGPQHAATLRDVLWAYYDLALERRPEFMGWSQTEPTRPTHRTAYNHFYYGDEAQRRLDRYAALMAQVKQLRAQMPANRADAFYELVYYPVVCAGLMNQKFLYLDKSYRYAQQNRACAADYARWATQAYADIEAETNYYNTQLAGGKWQGMMSMQPRNLPVYQAPALPALRLDTTQGWGVAPEGWADTTHLAANPALRLPTCYPWGAPGYFVDVFLSRRRAVRWRASSSARWLVPSATQGTLAAAEGQQQQRLQVRVDWTKLRGPSAQTAYLTFRGAGRKFRVAVRAVPAPSPALATYPGYLETNGYVAMTAAGYSRKIDQPGSRWEPLAGVGYAGQGLQAQPLQATPLAAPDQLSAQAAVAEYDFYTLTPAAPVVGIFTLPTHPITRQASMRYGVAIDQGPVQVVDFKTTSRSEEWKQNVLRNSALRQVQGQFIAPGRHTLRLYCLDPGVVLDRITIDLGGLQPAYGQVPDTRLPPPAAPDRVGHH